MLVNMKLDSVYSKWPTIPAAPNRESTGRGMVVLVKVVESKRLKRVAKSLVGVVLEVVGTLFLKMTNPARF
jgi:hypothetical protein